jgi:polyisoprenyl-phosphate glycosyltransferase
MFMRRELILFSGIRYHKVVDMTETADSRGSVELSVVVPVYGAPECLPELHQRLIATLSTLVKTFEIILVNDACPKGSWSGIKALAEKDDHVTGINLSRNFGQHYAITAGVDFARGDYIVVMDCDLQDQPEEIAKLYQAALGNANVDIVLARRIRRRDFFLKRWSSQLFYKILNYLTDTPYDHTIANFGVYRRPVADAFKRLRERLRFFPVMVHWLGFNKIYVDVDHARRKEGGSSYTFGRLYALAMSVILAFSDKPLRIAVRIGLLMSAASIIAAIIIVIRALTGHYTVQGWASLIVSMWFLSGLMIFFMGILGIYIGKTFDQVKGRPLYVVRDILNAKTE